MSPHRTLRRGSRASVAMARRIRELRAEYSLTLDEVAAATGFAKSSLSRWETGVVEPSLGSLVDLADYYEVTTDYLLGRED